VDDLDECALARWSRQCRDYLLVWEHPGKRYRAAKKTSLREFPAITIAATRPVFYLNL
jgi:hypothetical protein